MNLKDIIKNNVKECCDNVGVGAYEANGLKTKKKKKKSKVDETKVIKAIELMLVEDASSDLKTILDINGKNSKDYYSYLDKQIETTFPNRLKNWGDAPEGTHNKAITDFNKKRTKAFDGGMEDLLYDWGVDDEFKERFSKAIKGEYWGGNNVDGTGVYKGTSSSIPMSDFPSDFLQAIKDKAARYYDEYEDTLWLMDTDPKFLGTKKEIRAHAGQDGNPVKYGIDESINKKQINENNMNNNMNTIKRVTFKDKFLNESDMKSKVPQELKSDGTIFEMTDGNSVYRMRWDNINNVGFATTLEYRNEQQNATSLKDIKSMMHFDNSNNFMMNKLSNVNESKEFDKMMNLMRHGKQEVIEDRTAMINESLKKDFETLQAKKNDGGKGHSILNESKKQILSENNYGLETTLRDDQVNNTNEGSFIKVPDLSWTENYGENLNEMDAPKKKMQTTSNEFRQQVKDHIEELFDDSGYGGDIEGDNTYEKIWNTFKSEYGWAIERYGPQKAFIEWLSGLPSVLSVLHYHHEVQEKLRSWGLDTSKYDDTKNWEFYLYLIFREVNKQK